MADTSNPSSSGASGPGVVSTGWLAEHSTFDRKDDRRLGAGLGASLILHAVLLGAILLAFAIAPTQMQDLTKDVIELVYLPEPGPGGGGGGSPKPAPPKPLEIPKHVTPPPPPVVPIEAVVLPPPPPTLVAPVVTTNAQVLSGMGKTSISNLNAGGNGRGSGVGPGQGPGVGEGSGGGTGRGIYGPGSDVAQPRPLKEVSPKYTSEAMRAKIQGEVLVEIVINEDGTVDPNVQVIRSLDSVNGLDQEAIKAARAWLFQPGVLRSTGKPVRYRAQIALSFRIF